MVMSISVETKLDFDRSVSTEDRFAIRKAMDFFVSSVNKADKDQYEKIIEAGLHHNVVSQVFRRQ
jgi:hypothetical protein